MPCFITRTGSFLPGHPVANDQISDYLGALEGESEVRRRVLGINGITSRHYAQDTDQQATHDVYDMGRLAVLDCLKDVKSKSPITYLSAGTTYAPLSAPGIASRIQDRLRETSSFGEAVEIASHSGVCTSAAAAIVSAARAVSSGSHATAICVGSEHASEVLKSSHIQPVDDRDQHDQIRHSDWYMSVFLRFMLSDGAGAMLVQDRPADDSVSFQIDWTYSRSYAHQAPLCMKLENHNGLLSQDVRVLAKYLFPFSRKFVDAALNENDECLDAYRVVLPHVSSFFFRRKLERMLQELSADAEAPVPYWTNLASVGNTGSASIYLMLDEYLCSHQVEQGDRILLFVPESGQFNFVLISLTAIVT